MITAYAICAAVGGTIFVCQFLLSLFGLAESDHDVGDVGHDFGDADHGGDAFDVDHDAVGHDPADADHHDDSSWFFGVLTFRAVVAALTFFGLAGLAGTASSLTAFQTLAVATGAGVASLFVVHRMMKAFHDLRSEGNVDIKHAVGQTGTVYLTVPSDRKGHGKVTVSVQKRTMQFQAMTDRQELPTGSKVVVVDVIGSDTLEVEMATDAGRKDHA